MKKELVLAWLKAKKALYVASGLVPTVDLLIEDVEKFGEPVDEDNVREGERAYVDEARESVLREEARIACN